MPNPILPRRSFVAGSVPLVATDISAPGELLINWADKVAYTKDAAGNLITASLGGSSSGGGGGGGATELFEADTTAGFPATGSPGVLYISRDYNRIYRWDASAVYVELGTVGGGGGGGGGTGVDAELRAALAPLAPTSVTATGANSQVLLSWTAPTALLPVTDYVVQYSTNSGSTWTTFNDGASTATSATVTGLTNGTAYTFRVAAANSAGTGAYSTASSAVTPTAITPDPYFSSVALLLHADGTGSTFVDSSPTPKTITAVGNAIQSSDQSKFGGKSLLGEVNVSMPAMGTADFVIEMWAYANSMNRTPGNNTGLLATHTGSGAYPKIGFQHGYITVLTSAGWAIVGDSFSEGQWHFISLVRNSGTLRLYLDGIQTGGSASLSNDFTSGSPWGIGGGAGFPTGFDGYIDELRVTLGSNRGYGTSITVPTAAFPDA